VLNPNDQDILNCSLSIRSEHERILLHLASTVVFILAILGFGHREFLKLADLSTSLCIYIIYFYLDSVADEAHRFFFVQLK